MMNDEIETLKVALASDDPQQLEWRLVSFGIGLACGALGRPSDTMLLLGLTGTEEGRDKIRTLLDDPTAISNGLEKMMGVAN